MSPDVVRWRRGVEALDADVVAALTRPAVTTRFVVDLEAARPLVAAGLTWTPIFLKAAALAALAVPALHRMHGPFRVIEPRHADVGCSVAGDGMLAPVVVVPAADTLSLDRIAAVLKETSAIARRDERVTRARIDRLLWLVPSRWLRRLVVRAVFASPSARRRLVGTIQVSNIGAFDLDEAVVPMAAEILLVCGAVRERDGRLSATFVLHASHLKLNGVTGGAFVRRFREVLSTPALLGEDA